VILPIPSPAYACAAELPYLTLFLKSLDKDHYARVPITIQRWHTQELEGWFGLGSSDRRIKPNTPFMKRLQEVWAMLTALISRVSTLDVWLLTASALCHLFPL